MRIVWCHLIRPSGAWNDRYDYQTKEEKALFSVVKKASAFVSRLCHIIRWNSKLYKVESKIKLCFIRAKMKKCCVR